MILIGLIITSALFSCEDPSSLGIDLIDDNGDLAVLYTEIPLDAVVVRMDSISTTSRGIMMTGSHTDLDFGVLEVQSYLRILPPSSDPNIPEEVTEADSIRFDLRYNYFFGDVPSTHTLSVHQLQEQLVPDTIYYASNSTPFVPTSELDTTFMVNASDTLLSLNLESMKDELFAALKDFEADSANTAEFLEQFKGLTLISDMSSNAVLGFDNSHSDSNITLFYTTNDTVVNTININYSTYYNQITPDYTGTELEGINKLEDFETLTGRSYLQVGAGLVPKVSFQNYFDFVDNDTTGTIVINQAELKMGNLQGLSGVIEPPQEMAFYHADDNNRILIVGEQVPLPSTIQSDQIYIAAVRNNLDPNIANARSVRAQLDTTNVSYQPELTLFLQLIADGTLDRTNIDKALSVPYSFVEIPQSIFDNGRNVDRFIVEPEELKLEIFYTRLR
jgi:hypothetical protein